MATKAKAYNPDELVTIQLFKDNDRYKEDLFVSVNGQRFLIQRGKPVEVPAYVAEVIERSQSQDEQSGAMMERLAEEYVRKTEEKTKPE
jgi:hypothetical protein